MPGLVFTSSMIFEMRSESTVVLSSSFGRVRLTQSFPRAALEEFQSLLFKPGAELLRDAEEMFARFVHGFAQCEVERGRQIFFRNVSRHGRARGLAEQRFRAVRAEVRLHLGA